ncbi:MAG: hypothetical protein C5B53_11605 [Candidatus Melainabacteria bacterium]|nr:MAG: hypothetical protein C5B53_11605 [Candidatus Melainabacteria bacterium]
MALALVKQQNEEALAAAVQPRSKKRAQEKIGVETLLSIFAQINSGNGGKHTAEKAKLTNESADIGEKTGALGQPVKASSAEDTSEPSEDTSEPSDDWSLDLLPRADQRKLWHGLQGLAVMSFGVVVPILMMLFGIASCPKRLALVLINHPLETLAELVMVAAVPAINFGVWYTLCKDSIRLTGKHGLILGISAGTSLTIALTCLAGVVFGSRELESQIGTGFNTGFVFLSALSLCAGAVATYLIKRVGKAWDLPQFQTQVTSHSVVGALLAILIFATMEAMPWGVRIAERMAVSNSPDQRRQGLAWLRAINPEQQLRLECSDARAAGLVGLFIPLKSSSQHELYFAVTGKPYSYRDINNNDLSSMPDDYLSKNVVGERIKDLSLTRSSMTGVIHPNTLSSTIDWTLVFKNDSTQLQEARAEIKVPQDGVVTGLTLWEKGEPQDASFAVSGKVDGVSGWVQANHQSPAMLTYLGRGRALVHCYPVPQDEELKVRITFVVPLKSDGPKTASLVLPKFIATNFDLAGENLLRLRSDMQLSSSLANLKQDKSAAQEHVLSGTFADKQMDGSDVIISAARPAASVPVAVLDEHAMALKQRQEKEKAEEKLREEKEKPAQQVMVMIDGSKSLPHQLDSIASALKRKKSDNDESTKPIEPMYVVQEVARRAADVPKHLIVVLDGSSSMQKYSKELQTALAKLPANVPASLIVASQEQAGLAEPRQLSDGIKGLGTVSFVGGQDNLKALVKAAELAGESKGGAILWIHGPQPMINSEIYIVSPYVSAPRFYEFPLDTGDTDTCEFLRNHSEIGPFIQVPRSASVSADLEHFVSKWKPGREEYVASLSLVEKAPSNAQIISGQEVRELTALCANERCQHLIKKRESYEAATTAVEYAIVSPVSSALIRGSNEAISNIENPDAPRLEGATNGTIGPQGADVTVVTGVNTAGTVRVNNLANLEVLLGIVSSLCEVGMALTGAVILLHGLFVRITVSDLLGMPVSITPGKRIAIGVALIVAGLLLPGLLNWFVASARDANLFS